MWRNKVEYLKQDYCTPHDCPKLNIHQLISVLDYNV